MNARVGISRTRRLSFSSLVPQWPGAHSRGDTLDDFNANLAEVIEMLLEDGEPAMGSEFIGTQAIQVG
ncbi:MAG: type II toxin-antitoxin system HicB family antitoxin [Gemmataceae bacterium]